MSQREDIQSPQSYVSDMPAAEAVPQLHPRAHATRAIRVALPVAALWRYRVLFAGVAAILLAVLAEWLMRQPATPTGASSAPLGSWLMLLAALLVVPVAWVCDPWRRPKQAPNTDISLNGTISPSGQTSVPLPVRNTGGASQAAGTSLSTRAARGDTARYVAPARANRLARSLDLLRSLMGRYIALRARVGVWGTLAGLLVVVGLAAWLYFVMRANFADPKAPFVWLAMFSALALTFVGVRPRAGAATFMPHDPAEPAYEPRVSRTEWLILGVIMLAAVLLRFVNLENIPVGPYIDEAGQALTSRQINNGELVAGFPFSFFGAAWWGVPNLYFWLVAQSMRFFGDTLTGIRIVHALVGVATVWFTYRTARAAWSPRAGLLAATLITVSDFAIQSSRTVTVSTVMTLTWVLTFYYLYKGIKSRRPIDFVWSGLAAGVNLYTYGPGKLLPIFIALLAVYLVVRWGLTGAKRFVPLMALLAVTAGLTFLPHGMFLLNQWPEALTARSNTVVIWSPGLMPATFAQYGTNNWGIIVPRQFALTYSVFDVGKERGPFYPTDQPVLPIPWAALWVLGTAYMVFRLGDVRYATLALWLLAGLAGAALTNDTPTLQRLVGMAPTLALIPAIFLDRVASGLSPPLTSSWPKLPRRVARWASYAVPAALVVLFGLMTTTFYFGPYTARQHYLDATHAGRYAERLDPIHDTMFMYNIPLLLGDPSPNIFLGKNVEKINFSPSDHLPVTLAPGKAAHFLYYPANSPLQSILQSYYPAGVSSVLTGENNVPFIGVYKVDQSALAAQRSIVARYGTSGEAIERPEPRFGTFGDSDTDNLAFRPPAWISYPAPAQWSGGFIAPAWGRYTFTLDAPGGATLDIDGRAVLTETTGAGASVTADLALAQGVHTAHLTGALQDAQGRVDLRWSAGGAPVPLGRRFLWSGPPGALVGTAYQSGAPEWMTADPLPPVPVTVPPAIVRRDGFLSWLVINQAIGGGANSFCSWKGTLAAPVSGDYVLDANGSGQFSMWVDGKLVGARNVPGVPQPLPVTLPLLAGPHAFELRYIAGGFNAPLDLTWQPPGGQPQLIPPTAFAPPQGGVWPLSDMPGAPPLDPALIAP